MGLFDLIKPYLKQSGLSDEAIEELEKEASKPQKFEEMADWMQELEILKRNEEKWTQKVEQLVAYVKNEDFNKIKLEEMPTDPIEIHGYYFYLVGILRDLYPHRNYFDVINVIYQALHTLIDKWEVIKEGLIIREMKRQKAHNYNKEIENAREKAETQINKIKFENFINRTRTIDFLYEKALKERS